MKMFLMAASVVLVSTTFVKSVSAQGYPATCTSNYGYSAACCAASYGRASEGTMDNGRRHAELAACTAKAKKK
jgi:hypothetical protein